MKNSIQQIQEISLSQILPKQIQKELKGGTNTLFKICGRNSSQEEFISL